MSDLDFYVTMAVSGLAGLGMVTMAGLSGWRGWLQLKREALKATEPVASPSAGARIEIADLRERIRKLEAIAAGVEL